MMIKTENPKTHIKRPNFSPFIKSITELPTVEILKTGMLSKPHGITADLHATYS